MAVLLAESWVERNPTSIGVIATAVVGIIGWLLLWYFREKDKNSKHLDYRIISDIPIFSSSDRPIHLNVTYFEERVTDPRITHIRFKNTGKQVIRPADIIGEFRISRGSAKLLDGRLIGGSDWDLAQLQGDKLTNALTVRPETLNAGDWFDLRIIYDGGADENITVTGRIDGQTRRPEAYSPYSRQLLARRLLFFGTAAVASGLGFASSALINHSGNKIFPFLATLAVCIIAVSQIGPKFYERIVTRPATRTEPLN